MLKRGHEEITRYSKTAAMFLTTLQYLCDYLSVSSNLIRQTTILLPSAKKMLEDRDSMTSKVNSLWQTPK